jgi:hypothetical protein
MHYVLKYFEEGFCVVNERCKRIDDHLRGDARIIFIFDGDKLGAECD